MRAALKFLHELSTVGVMGAVMVELVLSWWGASLEPAEHAMVRTTIVTICNAILLPSLGVVLVSGLLAMAFNRSYHSADWALIKAFMTPLVFEATLFAVVGPARNAAQSAAKAAAGDAKAAELLAESLWREQAGLWVVMVIFTANIALAVWRPRRRRKDLPTEVEARATAARAAEPPTA